MVSIEVCAGSLYQHSRERGMGTFGAQMCVLAADRHGLASSVRKSVSGPCSLSRTVSRKFRNPRRGE